MANGHNSEAGKEEDGEEEKKEQADVQQPMTALERMKAKKEALKKKMAKARGELTGGDEEEKEIEEVVVKHSFAASGS